MQVSFEDGSVSSIEEQDCMILLSTNDSSAGLFAISDLSLQLTFKVQHNKVISNVYTA